LPTWAKKLRIDPYVLALLATVVAASILPASGVAATGLNIAAKVIVALLFFLHGAKLSREAVIAGLLHWRLHLTVLAVTFGLFPLLGLAISATHILPVSLGLGVLFLCCLPSTVQSSIAFTSIARGNIPAAVCAASASNIFGMVLTPLLVGLTMHAQGGGGFSLSTLQSIALQLLAPFIAGQLLQPWIKGWMQRTGRLLGFVDRGSILVIVYAAFSEAVIQGLWQKVAAADLAFVGLICAALLALVLFTTLRIARALKFSTEDEITILFCGSKKSLVSGAPMAAILFPPATAGVMILPLMLFHQMQMMACAVIAQRYAQRVQEPVAPV
jgi:sodium/bile acid cotransporter 7